MYQAAADSYLPLLQRFLQRDRTCLVRLAGKSDIPEAFLACVQAEPGFVGPTSSVLVSYADQAAFPRAQDWQRFAEMERDVLRECPWGALLIIRLHQEGYIPRLGKRKYAPIRAQLTSLPKRQELWSGHHLAAACALAGELYGLGQDLLDDVDAALRRQGQTLWVVYHDVETIFATDPPMRREVVTGLFELVQALDARHRVALRPLIFLEEGLWERLNFENKSHFTGRDLRL